MVRVLKLLCLFVIAALGLILHSRNPQPVTFDYYLGAIDKPLSLLLAVALLCGAVLGLVVNLWPLLSLKRENLRLRREMRSALVDRSGEPSSRPHVS